jgi:predicted DNA-binding transcriptional regulator AlpA
MKRQRNNPRRDVASDPTRDAHILLLVRELIRIALRTERDERVSGEYTLADQKAKLPTALQNFDTLPDSAHIDVQCLAALRGRSVASTWRDLRQGLVPPPKKFGASTRWNVGEVRRALAGA